MIKKAIIPAAGYGTRFLPLSKSSPKEMLPIIDKPTIHYVVNEAVEAGIMDILLITGRSKRAIEEYFDRNYDLENELKNKNKIDELKMIKSISYLANIHFIWQKKLMGLGDAILHAKYHVNNEPFVVLLGDTIIKDKYPIINKLINIYEEYKSPVFALEKVEINKISRYGIITGTKIKNNLYEINDIIEKPEINNAPTNLAIAGRYLFTPEIFSCIEKTKPGKNNEIQITDAIKLYLKQKKCYGYIISGKRYDMGNKFDFIKTNIEYGLENAELKKDLIKYLKEKVKNI